MTGFFLSLLERDRGGIKSSLSGRHSSTSTAVLVEGSLLSPGVKKKAIHEFYYYPKCSKNGFLVTTVGKWKAVQVARGLGCLEHMWTDERGGNSSERIPTVAYNMHSTQLNSDYFFCFVFVFFLLLWGH